MNTSSTENQFHKDLIDNLYDGVYFVDENRLITYWNKGAERITGYHAEDVLGKFCHANILDHVDDDGKHLCMDGCPLLATIQDGQPRESEMHLRHASGHRVAVQVRCSPIINAQNEIVGAVEVFSNNQSLFKMRRRVDELEKDVFRDALTQLGNRKLLTIKINSALQEHHEHGLSFGLLFIDIDHFKSINDTYGHQEGDYVLQTVGNNLLGQIRNTDVCGRWGGEEFVVILYDVNQNGLSQIAKKLHAMISSSVIVIKKKKVHVTISVGAVVAREGDTLTSIIERADQLMYQSKQNGRNQVTLDGENR